jgi:competence protein ComEA
VLPGVGPSLARAIILDRTARGPFHSIDDLARVKGIGPARLAALRPWLRVEGAP